MSKDNTMMTHSIGANTLTNATRFSYNSIQGHHHSLFGIERYADEVQLRWSMTVGCLMDPESVAARYARSSVLKRPVLGLGMLLGGDSNTLIISDTHFPYQHRDTFDFLAALDREYSFNRVLHTGDLYDHHRGSYHEAEPGSMGEEEEYHAAQQAADELQEMFPVMTITNGNHDAIPIRKLKSCGLPHNIIGDYNQMYGTHDGWTWTDRYFFDADGSFPVLHPMVLNKRGRWDKALLRLK
jgi:hypothetical protein